MLPNRQDYAIITALCVCEWVCQCLTGNYREEERKTLQSMYESLMGKEIRN